MIILGIGVIVLMMAAFSMGERVGFHKASFAFQNGNNFYRTFGPINDGPMMQVPEFSDTHGVVGKIVSIDLPVLTVEDKDNTEKAVVLSDQTIIRQFRNTLTGKDLTIGQDVVVIGDPNNQSQIVARLIRILPQVQQ